MKRKAFCLLIMLCMLFSATPVFALEGITCSSEEIDYHLDGSADDLNTPDDVAFSMDASLQEAQEYIENDIIFSVSDGKAEIVGYKGSAKELILPETVLGVPVVAVGNHAFTHNKTLERITFSSTIERIEDGEYIGFSSVDTETGISTFHDEGTYAAFYGCNSLVSVNIPEDSQLEYIGEYSFFRCFALSSVHLPSSIRNIACGAFASCSSLTEIVLPDGLQVVGQNAFSSTAIKSLYFPKSLQNFNLFNYMYDLEEIEVDTANPNYRSYDGIVYYLVDDNAWDLYFYPSAKKDSVYHVPDFVENFEGYAAITGAYETGVNNRVPYLEYVDIGDRELSVPGMISQEIIISDDNPYYTLKDGILYNKEMTTVWRISRSITGELVLPEGITTIATYAGSDCQFSGIQLPDTVVNYQEYAFSNNYDLTHIVFPENVQTFENGILYADYSLENCILPTNITELPAGMFHQCYALETVIIPEKVTVIGRSAFNTCQNLEELFIPRSVIKIDDAAFFQCSPDNIYYESDVNDWEKITISDTLNSTLSKSNMYYNFSVCQKPSVWHRWDDGQITLPHACSEDGIMTYTCLNDPSHIKNEVIPAKGHYLKKVKAQEATEETDGHIEYWICSDCGKLFLDKKGTQETTLEETVIRANDTEPVNAEALINAIGTVSKGSGDAIAAARAAYNALTAAQKTLVSSDALKILEEAEAAYEKLLNPDPKPIENPFNDVAEGNYFYDSVLWAVNHDPQITKGTSKTTFSPDDTCTRGQAVTFLWRAAGAEKVTDEKNPFTDVKSTDYFYDAVLWAYKNGVTAGTTETTFSPDDTCTRGEIVTFLWRSQGEKSSTAAIKFTDVGSNAFYYEAVKWAVEKDVTKGTTETTFSPTDFCKRGQIVTLLYRTMN